MGAMKDGAKIPSALGPLIGPRAHFINAGLTVPTTAGNDIEAYLGSAERVTMALRSSEKIYFDVTLARDVPQRRPCRSLASGATSTGSTRPLEAGRPSATRDYPYKGALAAPTLGRTSPSRRSAVATSSSAHNVLRRPRGPVRQSGVPCTFPSRLPPPLLPVRCRPGRTCAFAFWVH